MARQPTKADIDNDPALRWRKGYFDLPRFSPEFAAAAVPKPRTKKLGQRPPQTAGTAAPRSADPTLDWLQAAPAASADALARLGAEPEPGPDPTPPPSGSSPFVWPRNQTELSQTLQYFADDDFVGMLDPRTEIEMSATITVQQRANSGMTWGVRGNHARLFWAGKAGDDMLVYKGVNGVYNRCLFIEGLNLTGGKSQGRAAGSCLKLYATEDVGSIYKFTLRDIYTNDAYDGISLIGAVFEALLDNCHGENMQRDGLHMEHIFSPTWGIVSNIASMHANYSRNYGAGIRSVNSHNIIFGSFVLNGEGGVVAPDGLRGVTLSNGENTGEAVFKIPNKGWGSTMSASQGSTDGKTVCRAYENNQWVDKGKPQLYLLDGDSDWVRCNTAYYGDGTNQGNVRVQK